MTVKSITAAILAEAKQEVQGIVAAAQQDAEKLVAEQKEALSKERQAKEAAYTKEAEKVYGTEMVKAKFTLRNDELQARQALIDQAFRQTLDTLHGQPKEERKKVLAQLLKKANAQMDVATLYVAGQDKALVPSKYTVKTADIRGGLIAESKDGGVRVDLSYEALLADIKDTKVEAFNAGLGA